MADWYSYLKRGLRRTLPREAIGGSGRKGLWDNLKRLVPFFKGHWKKGLPGVVLIFMTAVLAFPGPLITRYLIDDVLLEKKLNMLPWVVLLLACFACGGAISGFLQDFYFNRFQQTGVLDIQQRLLDRVLRFPKTFFDQTRTGYLMARIHSDVQGLSWFFSGTVVQILGNTLRFFGGVGFLFYLHWQLSLAVLVVLPGIVIVVRYFSARIHILALHQMEQRAQVSSRMQESLSNLPLIKAFSTEEQVKGGVVAEMKTALSLNLEQRIVGALANVAFSAMPGVVRILVLGVGGFFVISGDWTLGSLLAYQSFLGFVFGPVQFLAQVNIQLQEARAALERVNALFDLVPEDNLGLGKCIERLEGEVRFDDVWFGYEKREPTLRGISFRVTPGEHLAIVGPSGAGKTTLISLILRFYRPTAGEIFFDQMDVAEIELGSLRRRIGYVSQSTLLLQGTIKENLMYGNPGVTDDEIYRALEISGMKETVQNLAGGLHSELGEGGVELSEGQRQRISIARALIKDPDILVLDEPTSALDTELEKSIFETLPVALRNKTLFVVAHRPRTIASSDRVLVLNEGRVEALGEHEALLQVSPYYRHMHEQGHSSS